jgi:hypothetical protein
MHDLHPDHDAMVTNWLYAHGWPVTERHYDFDRSILAWRAGGVRPIITLRVTRTVIEDVSPFDLAVVLDKTDAAKWLSKAPAKYSLVQNDPDTDSIVLVQLDRPPE